MTMVIAEQENSVQITFPMNEDEALQITRDIRSKLSDAREMILRMYREKGYEYLGYDSFKDWAKGEFEISWQQVYNLKTAAEVDENILPLVSPTGEPYNIPVNHARELRKLKTPEAQVQAFQMSMKQAAAQGEKYPTASVIQNTVSTMKADEFVSESSYLVVKQMVADGGITPIDGKHIVENLNKVGDDQAQVYLQKLMAEKGLKNPDLIYPLGHKYINERKRGKESKVLDEIDRTGCLAGVRLHKATTTNLKRANEEARLEHIAEAKEKKRQSEEVERQRQLELHNLDPENNPAPAPVPKQIEMNVWQHDSERTLMNLERELSEEDLDSLLVLLAERQGWVLTEAELTGDPFNPKAETGNLLAVHPFKRNALECNQADAIEMLIRVKGEDD